MKFFPADSFKVYSNLSFDEVKRRLDEQVAPKKNFSFATAFSAMPEKPYQGDILDDSFKITRNIKYRNSFLPIITGKIADAYPGTTIEVHMRMAVFVYIFMSVWFGGILIALVVTLREAIIASIIPLGMLIVAYLVMLIAYKYEVSKAKKFLNEIFQVQNEPDDYGRIQEPINTFLDENMKGL